MKWRQKEIKSNLSDSSDMLIILFTNFLKNLEIFWVHLNI